MTDDVEPGGGSPVERVVTEDVEPGWIVVSGEGGDRRCAWSLHGGGSSVERVVMEWVEPGGGSPPLSSKP